MMFSQKDLHQIQERGIAIDEINRQIKYFKTGFPPADITMPATPGKGIMCLTDGDEQHYLEVFRQNGPDFHIIRFIPASGAASRMFKSLYRALENLERISPEAQKKWIAGEPEISRFFEQLPEYPFYEDLSPEKTTTPAEVLKQILEEPGLGYGNKPKGLLKFHKYSEKVRRTPFEEHVREAVRYCAGRNEKLSMHLTVSPDHLEGFRAEAAAVVPRIEKETGLLIDISFSFQKPETDTIAVNLENEPFRNPDGSLLFRPGGHGALIQNLDALDSDLIFISNIDNVAPDRLQGIRVKYKQILGGILLEVRSKICYYLQQLTGEERVQKTRMDNMVAFLRDKIGMIVPDRLESWDAADLKQWLIRTMDRPIRVCGMVKNEGEPGGGPFYVASESGEISLQIVEASQIDTGNPEKEAILKKATHFNPVDLVCSTRNFRGEKFSLTRYVDPATGFISEKSENGKILKALERPGLWNGAMAHWLTLFAEVPVETFSPVKTVFDLMRDEHQP
ncbi:MAG TPA: DUF4301 family protein [Bacteroides sp.]|nr:DUF4301 family protein [Bacteroides sp.]